MDYKGVIIEESLSDSNVLRDIKIVETKIEPVTKDHKTPWLKQWTLHTVQIPEERASEIAKKISEVINDKPSSWYADFKNDRTHYIIYPRKIFRVNRASKEEYDAATAYGISLGIPPYQVDFAPYVKQWER